LNWLRLGEVSFMRQITCSVEPSFVTLSHIQDLRDFSKGDVEGAEENLQSNRKVFRKEDPKTKLQQT
jgi:hypothetical protein